MQPSLLTSSEAYSLLTRVNFTSCDDTVQRDIGNMLVASQLPENVKLHAVKTLSGIFIEKPTNVDSEAARRLAKYIAHFNIDNQGTTTSFDPKVVFTEGIKALTAYADNSTIDGDMLGIFARVVPNAQQLGVDKKIVKGFQKSIKL